jgi:O-antigen ligase
MSISSEAVDPTGRRPVLKPFFVPTTSRRWRMVKGMLLVGLILFCFIYGFFYALLAPYLMVVFAMPLGLLAGITVWALPDMHHPPTRSMTVMFFAFLVGLFMWPNYLAFAFPGMPWITMIRLTGMPLAGLFLISLSVSKEFRGAIGDALATMPWLWKMLVLFVVIQFLTLAVAHHFMDALQRVVIDQINWTVVFFASCYVFQREGRVERFAAVLWAISIGLCVIGVWEHHLGYLPWRDHIPFFLKIPDELVQGFVNGGARAAIGVHRVQATFSTPLGLGEYLALAAPFVVLFAVGKYPLAVRLAAAASLPLMLAVVLQTQARLGAVGFFLILLIYPLLWGVKRWRESRTSIIGPAIVLSYPFVFSLAVAAALSVHRLRARLLGNGAQDASNQSRIDQWHMGLPKVLSHPWGYGCGMSGDVLGYVAPGSDGPTIDLYYLRLLLEYGVLGCVVFLSFIIIAIYYAVKYFMMNRERPREFTFLIALAMSLINFVIIKSVFAQEDGHPLMFMMLGAVVALVYRLKQAEAVQAAANPTTADLTALPPAQAAALVPALSR